MYHPLFTFTDTQSVEVSGAGNWNFNKANRTLKLKRGKTVREIQEESKKVPEVEAMQVLQVPVEIPKPIPLELFPSETEREIARLMRELHEEEYQRRLEEANQFYQLIIEQQKLFEDEMEIELLMSAVLH